jgi:hypothetical protein
MNNKQLLYNAIMEKIAVIVKQSLNENSLYKNTKHGDSIGDQAFRMEHCPFHLPKDNFEFWKFVNDRKTSQGDGYGNSYDVVYSDRMN